jgi:hypothetical protein
MTTAMFRSRQIEAVQEAQEECTGTARATPLRSRTKAKGLVLYDHQTEIYHEISTDGDFFIGRNLDNDLQILEDHKEVSRVHCRIEHGFHLYDGNGEVESKNGTYVNGKRIKKTVLKPGQELSLGGPDITNSYFFTVCRKEELE